MSDEMKHPGAPVTSGKRLPVAGQQRPQAQSPRGQAAGPAGERRPIAGVRHLIAVASGKGGVGKSTVCVNLALALRQLGAKVGLMDADIYGPSIPMMMNVHDRPQVNDDGRIAPLTSYGVKLMSLGFLIEEGTPVIWRGPMVQGVIRQFLTEVDWGELDYLMIDLPPGTGDAQLTLVQLVPLTGALIVTTPSDIALLDAEKGLAMFRQAQVNVPILGIIENMSYFLCPHCQERTDVFSVGGGERIAKKRGAPLLGEVPLEVAIRKGGDEGRPVVAVAPDSPQAKVFIDIARGLRERLEGSSPQAEAAKKGFLSSLFSKR